MSVATKMFISRNNKTGYLQVLGKTMEYLKDNGWKSVHLFGYDTNSINIPFNKGAEEDRSMFTSDSYSCDYTDVYIGSKIIFSLGCWGESKNVMTGLAKHLKDTFGCRAWVCLNDCEDEFEEVV